MSLKNRKEDCMRKIISIVLALIILISNVCSFAESLPDEPIDISKLPELKKGDKDDLVALLQEVLRDCYYLDDEPSGTFDSKTVSALKDMQIVNNLKETGILDYDTWDLIINKSIYVQRTVYKSRKGKVYHEYSDCSGMTTAKEMPLSTAIRKGLRPCSKCH